MTKTKNDEAHEHGVRDGKDGKLRGPIEVILDDFLPSTETDDIYDAGYKEGEEQRESSVCYLTTACVNSMNLPDNCLELKILRKFRNTILMPTSKGRKAVKEYYEIAPQIVHSIDGQKDAKNILQQVYTDIRHAISLVLNKDFEGAFEHYKQMTLNLKEKFL